MDFMLDDETTQPATMERDIVPAGIHAMTIRACEEGPNQYKTSDENPDGLCLKLRLATATGNYKFVFDDIPKHLAWRAKQLAEAVGIAPVNGRLAMEADDLIGREVMVKISHYTSKAGKVSAVVQQYVAGEKKPGQAAPRIARTTAAKAHAAFKSNAGSDDIPF